MGHRNLGRRPDGTPDDDTGELAWRDRGHHAPINRDRTGMRYMGYFLIALLVGGIVIGAARHGISLPLG